ncbi:MAG TPA: LolA-like putative outer membrane lipoprotein chaperone [Alloprevotella sp.]|nr:LolA-like putative outer membrane lipoprotein chaperone [Alloprevotella sp.]
MIHLHRLILCWFAFWTTCVGLFAQDVLSVMERTAMKLKNSNGIEASFEATSFNGTQASGSIQGKIMVQGNKFRIQSEEMSTWFDGKTQWTQLSGSNEVNVSSPTQEEIQQQNPYAFIDLYKKGYARQLAEATHQGKSCYEVRLVAQDKKNKIQEMRLTIDKKTFLPLSVRTKMGKGNWLRIRVNSIKMGKKWKDDIFRFDKKQHPDIEIIDLR